MAEEKTLAELASMSMHDRIRYFMDHPLVAPADAIVPNEQLARHRARAVDKAVASERARAAGSRRAS